MNVSTTRADGAAARVAPSKEILVVDDMPEICDYFVSLAKRIRGFNVHLTTEVNSARALDLLRSKRFDLVVSDYRMREVDGVDVLRSARDANPSGHRILMTGYNEIPTTIARIRAADVDAYIQKPLSSHDLLLLLLDFIKDNEPAIRACREQARELELVAMREEQGAARFPDAAGA